MNLQSLFNSESVDRIATSTGELCLYWLGNRDARELLDESGRKLAADDPESFVRRLAKYVFFPSDQLREGKYKPNAPVLDEQQLAKLTAGDLERIAESYLKNNEDLYRERIEVRSKDASGTPVYSFRKGEVKTPRIDGESATQYLSRLLLADDERRQRQDKKFHDSLRKSFSSGLLNDIDCTQAFGEEITRAADKMRSALKIPNIDFPKIDPIAIEPPRMETHVDVLDVLQSQQRAYERPFRDLASKLDALLETTGNASKFAAATQNVQIQIAGELKASGDENKKTSKTNIRLSYIVIVLTALGLIFAVYQSLQVSREGIDEQKRMQANVARVVDELRGIHGVLATDAAHEKMLAELKIELAEVKAQLNERARATSSLEAVVESQAKEIKKLREASLN
jgi:hypothetical protein